MIMPIKDAASLLARAANPLPAQVLAGAQQILEDVRRHGRSAVENYAAQWDGWVAGQPMLYDRAACEAALANLADEPRQLLQTAAERIRGFAARQRQLYQDFDMPAGAEGLSMGVRHIPIERVGCYAPGGRYPLVSSVLMTVIPAQVAGVRQITLASPNPAPLMLAAAAIAGAHAVLAIGGAQAIATLAFGGGLIDPCDMIVGPGNQWVAAAKQMVANQRGIDFLAGPSELLIIADDHANPAWIAADLLAQAEHDTEAIVTLLTPSSALLASVQDALAAQLPTLPQPNQSTARAALSQGAMVQLSLEQAVQLANQLAPEHLQIMTENPSHWGQQCTQYGGIFVGARAAEVLGDYGLGPNHTLPTNGSGRFHAGLSVSNFLKPKTFITDHGAAAYTKSLPSTLPGQLAREIAALARLEGLEAHARAVECRAQDSKV
jgi:phosphoribosyl-ATP pyrophosphohydrolase/phosphoribosyl-AMP cyclohydrolase/histidinol dehydrogenase